MSTTLAPLAPTSPTSTTLRRRTRVLALPEVRRALNATVLVGLNGLRPLRESAWRPG